MKSILLKNAAVITPAGRLTGHSVLVEDGRINAVFSSEETVNTDIVIDLAGAFLYPGFIDIHIHGAAGVDVMNADLPGLEKMAAFLAKNGVTRWMPTFVPDSEENYRKAVGVIDEFINWQQGKPVAQVAGVHYEGPFVNEHQCGALRPHFFRRFENGDELASLPTLASNNAKHLMTLAPEVSGGIGLIEELRKNNWIASIGHTRADVETLNRAFEAGAHHMTHFFNAMSGLHHRDTGVVGWGLMNDGVTCDVIADGIHVHPDMLKLLHKNKTFERIALISDSVLPAGLGDGEYEVWSEKISVKNGRTENERGSIAGSVITMLDAVRRMLSLGISDTEVARMAGGLPAKILGLEKVTGEIAQGFKADLVALNDQGDVILTVIEGNIVES